MPATEQTLPIDEPEAAAASEQDERTALQKVEALLAEPATPAETPADDAQVAETPPLTVASLAEKLATDPKSIYALEVPLADGKTITLGELKDGFRPAADLAGERAAFLEERGRYEADRRQNDQELQEFLRQLPPEALDPRLVAQAKAALTANRESEHRAFLRDVPEWNDPVRVTADRNVMEAYIAGFGFSKADLASVTDHRLLRLVRTAALREAELKAIKAERPAPVPASKAVAPKANKPSTANQDFGRLKAQVTTKRISPAQAVERLLKDAGHGR